MTKILGILISNINDSKCDVEEVEIFDTNKMTVEELKEVYSMMFDQDELIWAIFDISNIEEYLTKDHPYVISKMKYLSSIYSNTNKNLYTKFNPSIINDKEKIDANFMSQSMWHVYANAYAECEVTQDNTVVLELKKQE